MNAFGQPMTEAEIKAEEMRKKDAEMLARRKKKFDAARFDHIEKTNTIHGQPKPQAPPPEPQKAPAKEEGKKKGWRIFKKKPKDSNKTTTVAKESSTSSTTTTTTKVAKAKPPPPIAAGSVKPKIYSTPLEIAPNWAGVDQKNVRPQPNVGHSSDLNYPRPMSAAKIPAAKTSPATGSKKAPSTGPPYNTVGYGTAGRKAGTGISGTIAAFSAGASKPKTGGPRNTKQPRVETSTSESMDVRGNITRTITRKITEPNGNVKTETEVIKVPPNR
uniref:Uncharacterized protein n=1 Tax=Pseudo-nitzschia australis TaxID=44445 RepID=A0A7S4AR73_9STRA|mmetsp:Transcript_19997/g.43490  ORF Transcript_19997/g.43490 Transcript_19997/m.43490 type:complete len:273 (-) Transcript_19997:169-987(-)|eukprot:CAMPEP_0168175790 /NCGR_PEP_ID=MMETSP0139_2-20121125/7356_1 /TAXON_ID=44445 /ORGANISM="Pseudo-nitzschia australis, Strain 10249 10 AB" /LENGTH=272 /DNA_ID=CAMNT_0008094293 /DNA_START=253 /DNA_END=1071 /DNA_ORIENTATION=+